jgi:hypothetical protein
MYYHVKLLPEITIYYFTTLHTCLLLFYTLTLHGMYPPPPHYCLLRYYTTHLLFACVAPFAQKPVV